MAVRPDAARHERLGDAVLLCLLGVLCVRSYEAMVYLGPLVAAAIAVVASRSDRRSVGEGAVPPSRRWPSSAASAVGVATIVDYWDHPHFLKVRSTSFDFWQNLQFAIPLVGLAICGGDRAAAAGLAAGPRAAGRHRHRRRRCSRSRRGGGWSTSIRSSIRRRTISPARRRACCWRCCWSACGCTSPGSASRPRSSPCCASPRSSRRWCWP